MHAPPFFHVYNMNSKKLVFSHFKVQMNNNQLVNLLGFFCMALLPLWVFIGGGNGWTWAGAWENQRTVLSPF